MRPGFVKATQLALLIDRRLRVHRWLLTGSHAVYSLVDLFEELLHLLNGVAKLDAVAREHPAAVLGGSVSIGELLQLDRHAKPVEVDAGQWHKVHLPGHVDGYVGRPTQRAIKDGLRVDAAIRDVARLPVVLEALAGPCLGDVEGPVGIAGSRDHYCASSLPLLRILLRPMSLQCLLDKLLLRVRVAHGVRRSVLHHRVQRRHGVNRISD